MPYGSPYDGQYREGPGYAGHVTDTQTNLTYMQQRYYDPVALRFLSPDPVDVNPADGSNFSLLLRRSAVCGTATSAQNPGRHTPPRPGRRCTVRMWRGGCRGRPRWWWCSVRR